jgi:MFS family permease
VRRLSIVTGGKARVLVLGGFSLFLSAFAGSVLLLALPAVARDFGAGVVQLAQVGALLGLGAIAGLPLSSLADRIGRRPLIALGVAGFSAADLASAFVTGLPALAVARVVAVCFESVVGSVATVLVVEEMPENRRALAVSAVTLAGGMGVGLTTVLYPIVAPNWRLLYLAGSLGLPLALLIWRYLPESSTWHSLPPGGSVALRFRLLAAPPWRARLALLAIASGAGALLFAPAGLFFALFGSRVLGMSPVAISVVVVVAGAAGAGGYVAGGWLGDRLGRRWLAAGLGVATALFAGFAFADGLPGFWLGNVTWSLLASAASPILGAWIAELFPTRARATAVAVATVAASLGGIVGLELVGWLDPALGLGRALLVMAAGAAVGAALLALLPETRGRPLPD